MMGNGFRDHDRKTFVADTAAAYARGRINKREFLRRTTLAGVGLSTSPPRSWARAGRSAA